MPSRAPRLMEEHAELIALVEQLLALTSGPVASADAAHALVSRIATALHTHLEHERDFPYGEILHRDLDRAQAARHRREADLRELDYDLGPYFDRWSSARIAGDSVGFAEATLWTMTHLLRRIAIEDGILHTFAEPQNSVAAA